MKKFDVYSLKRKREHKIDSTCGRLFTGTSNLSKPGKCDVKLIDKKIT